MYSTMKEKTHNSATATLLGNSWSRWTGPEQFEDPSGQLMMLPADMALVWDKGQESRPLANSAGAGVNTCVLC